MCNFYKKDDKMKLPFISNILPVWIIEKLNKNKKKEEEINSNEDSRKYIHIYDYDTHDPKNNSDQKKNNN